LRKANEIVKARLFFFAASSVNVGMDRIDGTYWNPIAKRWKQQSFSIPNILYVRGGGDRTLIENLVSKVRKRGIVINYPPFDKWTLYQNLIRNEYMQDYLPDTVIYQSEKDLENMLAKYGQIYLKPTRGRKGRNVVRVRQKGEGYHISFFVDIGSSKGLKQFDLSELDSVVKFATRMYRGNLFLVQQAIDLVTFDGKLVDLRAEMVRNSEGKVEIIAVSARVGGSQSPITTHSSVVSLDYYLSIICKYPRNKIYATKNDIKEFLISTYRHVEAHHGMYGEIGIDFGIDRNGKLWFIECNSQSAKISLAKAYGTDAVYRSFFEVISYSAHAYRQRQRVRKFRLAKG